MPKFEVIKGGLTRPPHISEMEFVSAYATDTRLMGVVGLYINWKMLRDDYLSSSDFHQFFYFETEEFGLEEYCWVEDEPLDAIIQIETSLFAGLGGEKVELTEREALYLLQTFVDFNLEKGLPLPPNSKEHFLFLIEPRLTLSAKERSIAMSKICTEIETKYQAIHYFMMRIFGKDFSGASYLIKGNIYLNIYDDLPISSLCHDSIKEHVDEDGNVSYMVESVIDAIDQYLIILSEVTVDEQLNITSFCNHQRLKISPPEMVMKMRRSEYMTVYFLAAPPFSFEGECKTMASRAVTTSHETGKLYMFLHGHNEHVKGPVFSLPGDVAGLIYVTDFGELLVAAYTLEEIHTLEEQLRRSRLSPFLRVSGRYEFKEPLLYEFVNSGVGDFDEFLDMVRQESDVDDEDD